MAAILSATEEDLEEVLAVKVGLEVASPSGVLFCSFIEAILSATVFFLAPRVDFASLSLSPLNELFCSFIAAILSATDCISASGAGFSSPFAEPIEAPFAGPFAAPFAEIGVDLGVLVGVGAGTGVAAAS